MLQALPAALQVTISSTLTLFWVNVITIYRNRKPRLRKYVSKTCLAPAGEDLRNHLVQWFQPVFRAPIPCLLHPELPSTEHINFCDIFHLQRALKEKITDLIQYPVTFMKKTRPGAGKWFLVSQLADGRERTNIQVPTAK